MKKVICDHAGECEYWGCPHRKKHKTIRDCKTACGLHPAAECVEAPDDNG